MIPLGILIRLDIVRLGSILWDVEVAMLLGDKAVNDVTLLTMALEMTNSDVESPDEVA